MHSEYIVNIAQLWLRAGNYVEEIKYLIHGYQNQNDFKGWILMTLISADRAHNVSLNRNQDAVFIPEKLLALTPAECISDLNKLLKETKDEGGKFWQKSLHVKAALLAGIAVLEKEAKGANFVSNAITEKENPRIFKHLNNSPRESLLEASKRKTQNLNDAIDKLVSKLTVLQTCFKEGTKEYAQIEAEKKKLNDRKLNFKLKPAVTAKIKAAPNSVRQSDYSFYRPIQQKKQPKNNPFEPQWWWLAIPFLIPAAAFAW